MKTNNAKPARLEVILALLSIMAVIYGMAEKNHPIFIVGLLIGLAAYLLIRKRLKASIRENERSN